MQAQALVGGGIGEYLARAASVILDRYQSEVSAPVPVDPARKLRVGVDLGTAYMVLVVLDEDGLPLAGEWQWSRAVRDGLMVDFMGAAEMLRGMKNRVERRIGRGLTQATSGYPPGVPRAEIWAKAHVVEAAGMRCTSSIDEPSAANLVLSIRDGAVADVGGGTTGIAVLRDGRVVHTADEATGGVHFSLVIAGALNLSLEEAEALKVTPAEQPRLLPLVRPVMEKVAGIIVRHTQAWDVGSITLVGGSSAFPGMADVVRSYTGIPAAVPAHPLFVTPLGMALHNRPNGAGRREDHE